MSREVYVLAYTVRVYLKLSYDELTLFLKIRNLTTQGSHQELAWRLANHDKHTYHFNSEDVGRSRSPSCRSVRTNSSKQAHRDLPIEIMAEIMDRVGDWELVRAVGIPTSLPRPLEWSRASCMDEAILTGNLTIIRALDPRLNSPTSLGAVAAIRFGYVHVLEYFLSQHHSLFLKLFADIIPIKASRHGRIPVLSWWKHGFQQHPDFIPPPRYGVIAEAVDGASRNGQVASLDWWLAEFDDRMQYTDAALEYASAKNRIAVLDWWKEQHLQRGLPLRVGRVMDMASTAGNVDVLEWWASSQIDPKYDKNALQHASCHGKIEVLDWWLGSGLPLAYDQDVLTGATRHNRPEVLEWWDRSGLPIQYRMCDIEEALEDAIGGGGDARAWWKRKGVDFNANDKEWMKLQNLH
ncbi:hypothetical protein FISHEDRAFT_64929 [Fistulina hepatica ATCC 64428]|uniref:SAP domain-containing protein n=1 Tax=Fistulina hepatica ATCC 64428 TaxID=1128425 RepID=A0A0D7AGN8_9AGAR|nr:hypothetical protein FISHEDRAFT_64929 [Fistulina hepatica ATCC 64428]